MEKQNGVEFNSPSIPLTPKMWGIKARKGSLSVQIWGCQEENKAKTIPLLRE